VTVEVPHGTRAGYAYHGCRCDECRVAVVTYNRLRREQAREKTRWEEERLRLERLAAGDLPAPPPPADTSWMPRGACRGEDTGLFFPAPGQGRGATAAVAVARAKAVCSGCPVIGACLDYAVTTDQRFGVWGGLTAHERRPGRRKVRRYW
jgi:WhiB family redox-sensing transcriptional regulator